MPISSNQVSNIITGQVGMFSASAQYAQAISSQYGFQSGGSVGIADPRDHTGHANMGAFAARAPGFALGGLGLMGAFNYAPRIFDPFTTTLHAGRMGMQGAGIAGGLGMGALTAGAYMGASSLIGWGTNQMVTGAQNRGLLNQQIGGIFPNMNSQGLNMMAGQVEAMSRSGMGSIRELASLMQQGAATGALDTGSLNQFSQSFRKLIQNVRQVATTLNSSMTEAGQALQAVKAMGVSSSNAAGFLGAARGIGATAKLSPGQMMGVAQAGAQFGFSAGISRQEGAMGGMVTAGVYKMAQDDEIWGVDSGSQSRYTRAASRFLLSRHGRTVLGAMMGRDGEIDIDAAQAIAGGQLTRNQIKSMYSNRINSQRMRRFLNNRGTEIAGQFISQFGPESVTGGLEAMTTGAGQDTEMLQRALTGLNRRDIDNMRQLSAASPMLRQKLIDEARSGFREGQMRMSATQMLGVAFDKMVKPIREQFREMGASMTQSIGDAMEQISSEFVQRPGPQASRSAFMNRYHAMNFSNNQPLQEFYGSQMGGMGTPGLATTPGRATGVASFVNYLPAALRMGVMPQGTTLADLPMGGMTTLDPQDAMNVGLAGMALRANVFAGNRNVVGAAGATLGWMGKQWNRAAMLGYPGGAAAPKYPWMGFTGVNSARGLARMPGGMMKVGGWVGRGLGRLGGLASLPMMMYGMGGATAQASRAFGLTGISEGVISGNNKRLLESLENIGFLGADHIGHMDIGDQTNTYFPEGAVGIMGIVGADGQKGGSGYQRYLSEGGQEKLKALYGSGRHEALTNQLEGLVGQKMDGRRIENVGEARRLMSTLVRDVINMDGPKKLRMSKFQQSAAAMGLKLSPDQLAHIGVNMEYEGQTLLGGMNFEGRMSTAGNLGLKNLKPIVTKFRRATNADEQDPNIFLRGKFSSFLESDPNAIYAAQAASLRGESRSSVKSQLRMALMGNQTKIWEPGVEPNSKDPNDQGGVITNRTLGQMRGSEMDLFLEYVMGGFDKGSALNKLVQQSAVEVDEQYGGGTSLAPPVSFQQQYASMLYGQGLVDQAQRQETRFGLSQLTGILGVSGFSANRYINENLSKGDTVGAGLANLGRKAVDHMFDLHSEGRLPTDEDFGNARNAAAQSGPFGDKYFSASANAARLIRRYDKLGGFRGKRGSNARFLSETGRMMGLNFDFTKFKDKDDVDYLRGARGKDGNYAISSKLQYALNEYGSQLFKLREGREATASEAQNEANQILDSLQDQDNRGKAAITRISNQKPPSSPSASRVTQGGIQQTAAMVDDALQGIAWKLKNWEPPK